MSETKDPERRFFEALGYRFEDRTRLLEALTHRSFVNEVSREGPHTPLDNERLEFLGDAVLDLIVSAELMARFPQAREGEMSRMRATIVHEGALADLARKIELGPVLRLGRGEAQSGGRERASLLADAFEAVVAALYLEAGFERTAAILRPLLDFEPGIELAATDPKTALQQRVQARQKLTPHYRLIASEGPEHERTFRVQVLVGEQVIGEGVGRSKKQAEQAAASAALKESEA